MAQGAAKSQWHSDWNIARKTVLRRSAAFTPSCVS